MRADHLRAAACVARIPAVNREFVVHVEVHPVRELHRRVDAHYRLAGKPGRARSRGVLTLHIASNRYPASAPAPPVRPARSDKHRSAALTGPAKLDRQRSATLTDPAKGDKTPLLSSARHRSASRDSAAHLREAQRQLSRQRRAPRRGAVPIRLPAPRTSPRLRADSRDVAARLGVPQRARTRAATHRVSLRRALCDDTRSLAPLRAPVASCALSRRLAGRRRTRPRGRRDDVPRARWRRARRRSTSPSSPSPARGRSR